MRGPKPPVVELSPEVRHELEALLRRRSLPQQLALRARIVLAAADDQNNSQIARPLGLEVDTVRLWRNRWLSFAFIPLSDLSLDERLSDVPRSGRPIQITAENAAKSLPSPVKLPKTLAAPFPNGLAVKSPTKSSSVAFCPRFHRAMPRACSKRGSQTASEPLLAHPTQG